MLYQLSYEIVKTFPFKVVQI